MLERPTAGVAAGLPAEDVLRPSFEAVCAAWAARVRANREQVDRLREVPDAADFYGPVSSVFRVDPFRTDEPALGILLGHARPGERWLDIGAGAGRYALPVAHALAAGGASGSVIAVDPSPGMLAALREDAATHGIRNVDTIEGRWPLDAHGGSPDERERARGDVAMIAHVSYDIEQIGPFVDAMEASAGRLCVAILTSSSPTGIADPFWPGVHREPRVQLPTLREFITLLIARGRLPEVRLVDRAPRTFETREELVEFARHHTWVEPGGEKDRRLVALAEELAFERDGRYTVESGPAKVGIVTWDPAEGPAVARPAAMQGKD